MIKQKQILFVLSKYHLIFKIGIEGGFINIYNTSKRDL
jgi:hypothetical protein